MEPIPFNKPFIIGRELALIADAVAQCHLSGDGAYTKLCQQWPHAPHYPRQHCHAHGIDRAPQGAEHPFGVPLCAVHSSPAGCKYGRANGNMKVTDDMSERLLCLPLHYEMDDADVARIYAAIRQFFAA